MDALDRWLRDAERAVRPLETWLQPVGPAQAGPLLPADETVRLSVLFVLLVTAALGGAVTLGIG